MARIGPELTPELQYVALLADEGVVLTSDQVAPLEAAVEVARGDADALESVDEVVEASGSPVAASVFTGAHACEQLAMASADADDQAEADALLEQAGEVHPMTGFAMALRTDGDIRVAMSFEDDDAARTDADTRATLASGPAPGQGGDFPDRFTLEDAVAADGVVTLDLSTGAGAVRALRPHQRPGALRDLLSGRGRLSPASRAAPAGAASRPGCGRSPPGRGARRPRWRR